MYLAKNINYLRKKSGLTQTELAERLGVSKSQVSSYEKGNSLPKLEGLIVIGEIFEVNIDQLVHQDLTKGQVPKPTPTEKGSEELQSRVNDLLEKRVRELEREIKRRDAGWAKELGIE